MDSWPGGWMRKTMLLPEPRTGGWNLAPTIFWSVTSKCAGLLPTELFTEIPQHEKILLPEGELKEIPVFLRGNFTRSMSRCDPKDTARASAPLWYRLGDREAGPIGCRADGAFTSLPEGISCPRASSALPIPSFTRFWKEAHGSSG